MVVNLFYQEQNLHVLVLINYAIEGGSHLWNNLLVSVKNCQSVSEFKLEFKKLGNIHCTSLVCC